MRFTVLTSLVFAALAAAAPSPGGGGTANACQGGETWCCNNYNQPVDNSTGNPLSVPLDVILSANCSPLSVFAILLGTQCASSTVCCQNMNTSGLVNIQCIGLAL
ncbi:fungal hydrophobin [Auricularia subglabra TFB-10046 SS5]|nr:fungal hydrophobin [Auricularia subglabra TFB-10046 SS5]